MGLNIDLAKAGLTTAIEQDFDHACATTMWKTECKTLEGYIRGIDTGDLLGYTGLKQEEPFPHLRRPTLSTVLHCR